MDVQLPDGRLLKGVPDGTTKAQLTAKLQANSLPVPEAKKPKEEEDMFTVDARVMHEAGADDPNYVYGDLLPFKRNIKTGERSFAMPEFMRSAVRGVGDLIQQAQSRSTEETPDSVAAMMTFMPMFKPAAQLTTKAAETVGGKALDLAGKAREKVNAKSDSMARTAAVEKRPIPPSLMKGPGDKPLSVGDQGWDNGRQVLKTALAEDGISPLDVAERLEAAKASGQPVTAMDVITRETGGVHTHGKNTLYTLKAASALPGQSASLAGDVAARGYKTSERIGGMLDRLLSKKGFYETSDEALKKMQDEAPKAYKIAFEGGSIAPLEKQLEGEFQAAAAARAVAQKEVDQANQAITFIEAKKQTNANVYVDARLIAQKRAAYEQLAKAQKKLEAADAQEGAANDILRQAQSDRKNGVKGAVWSPRLQELLSDDVIQRGIKKGLWIARKEALANGEKFNPTEWGIIESDKDGFPTVVSKVPNMRMLDAGKKGLDAILNSEESKNQLTGKMNETGRAITMLKNAYLKEIDRMNPDYPLARRTYGDQAAVIKAAQTGRDFMHMDKEEIAAFMKNPDTSLAEKSAFASGVRRALQDKIDATKDGSNPINFLWKQSLRDKLAPVFPDEAAFKQFSGMMEQEQSMQRVNSALATGSHTNVLGNFQSAIRNPRKMAKAVLDPKGAMVDLGFDAASKVMQKRAANMDKETAAAVARYLTTDDPEAWYDLAVRLQ